jgi:hypothetical protein
MKTRIGLLIASAAIASATFFSPTPASAHTEVCVGSGVAVLSNGLGLPGLTNAHATFTFQLGGGVGVGVCTASAQVNASGSVWGACGLSTGNGTANGHAFSFVGVGSELVVTGAVTGTVNATEDPLDAGSCTDGTATRFLVTGEAVLND